jgi:curved DNA-binding protein CbpA
MAILNEAWRVLRSPSERALYDARRAALEVAANAVRSAEHARGPLATSTPASSAGTRPVPMPPAAAPPVTRHAVPCGSTPGCTILSFGRYEGWSLADLAGRDPDYLEWLARTPIGRGLEREIHAVLTRSPAGPRTGADLRRAFAGR